VAARPYTPSVVRSDHGGPPSTGVWSALDRFASRRGAIAAVAGLALVVRLAYLWLATWNVQPRSDAVQYLDLGRVLSNGQGYVDIYPQLYLHQTAFRPPGYPSVLGLMFTVTGPSYDAARYLNVLLGTAVVVCTFLLVRRHLGPRAAVVTAVLVTFIPNFLANDTYPLSDALSMLLLVGVMWFLLERNWWASGLLLGTLVLTRPSAQFLVVVAAVWLWHRLGWRTGWRQALGLALIVGVFMGGWMVRNWVQLGEPVFVTSNGFNLAARYSKPATDDETFIDANADPRFDDIRLTQFNETEWDRTLRQRALDNIKDDPAVVPEVVWRNVRDYLELRSRSSNDHAESIDGRSMTVRDWTLWLFYPFAVIGTIALWLRRRLPLVGLAGITAIYFFLVTVAFASPPRLRAPVELMWAIGIGALFAVTRSNDDEADRDDTDDTNDSGDPGDESHRPAELAPT
jgi:4-amino-4-deoxy-L-arabinose transferase-like glycosyltransferase